MRMRRLGALIACMGLFAPACSGGDGDGGGSATDAGTGTTGTSGSGTTESAGTDGTDGTEGTGGSGGSGGPTTGVGPMGCQARPPVVPTADFFVDISDASGMRVDNFYENPAAGTAINDHSRLAFADIDGDGFDDMVMHSLFPNPQNGVPFEHLVFLNDGTGGFEDFSDASGLRDVQAGFFAFADVDNDGDQDAFAGQDLDGYGAYESEIYLNDGEGHFSVLADSGVEASTGTATNAVFADFNNDGKIDLFVGHGGTTYAATDKLYAGQGDGTFVNGSGALTTMQLAQPSNGSVTCDYDNDGDLDIFVSTYSVSTHYGHNHLWENDGSAIFENVALLRGFAYQVTGNSWLSSTGYGMDPEPAANPGVVIGSNAFGIDCGDIDNDGDLDVLLATISHPVDADYSRKWSDPTQILANGGEAMDWAFTNQWQLRGLPFNEGDIDAALVDFDNDGRLDIALTRERKYEGNYSEPDQKSWFGLMRQLDTGAYESVGVTSGINDPNEDLLRMKGGQNQAWSDIDHDGDLDLLVGGRDQGGGRPNFLFRNDSGDQNRWLAVRLEGDGVAVNRDAIGARVTLQHADGQIMREKKSSRGTYNSEDTRVLHFGLGDSPCERTLHVRWPDGTEATFDETDFGDDMYVKITYPDALAVE